MNAFGLIRPAIASTALALFAAVGAAHADQGAHATEVPVSYADLNLASEGGAQELHDRLRRAARKACRQPGMRGVQVYRVYRECYRNAMTAAVDEVGAPILTLVHLDRNRWARDRTTFTQIALNR